MRAIQLLAATIAALFCAPTPAAALGVSPLHRAVWSEDPLPRDPAIVEFDVNDWAAFIRGDTSGYELDVLGSDIDRLVAFDEIRPVQVVGVLGVLRARALTRASARP